jgi:hypothetical protein
MLPRVLSNVGPARLRRRAAADYLGLEVSVTLGVAKSHMREILAPALASAALALALLALGGYLASAARGATRYASPTGAMTEPCAVSEPCELAWAIEKAKPGDEVVVEASALPYVVSKAITTPMGLTIHGPASGPLPQVDDAVPTLLGSMLLVGGETTVSRLHLVATEPQQTLLTFGPSVVEHLLLEAHAAKQTLAFVFAPGGVLRDSVLSSNAEEAIGVRGSWLGLASFLRNDTIELPGAGSIALHAEGLCSKFLEEPICFILGAPLFDVANTILRGGLLDLDATSQNGFAGRIEISHSNYRAAKILESAPAEIKDNGGNQTSVEPSLTSDFHELAGSVTIDAGIVDAHTGTQDPDGNPRVLGAAPDIGAYEFVPPVPPAATTSAPPTPPGSTPPPVGQASVAAARASGATVLQTLACAGTPGQSCRFGITLTSVERLAGKRLLSVGAARRKVRKLRVTVGTFAVTLQAGQVVGAVVRLNATGRRLLARLHSLHVTVTTTATNALGKNFTLTREELTLRSPARTRHR